MASQLDFVTAHVSYDPQTGVFTWVPRKASPQWNGKFAGKRAGWRLNRGYWVIEINGERFLGHRLAWLIMTGDCPECDVEHENLDKSDNRFCNLRLASRSQNMANTPLRSTNTSGFKGVSWKRHLQKWVAQITHNGKNIYLGVHETKEQAHEAYRVAAERCFGEFARA